MNPVAGIPVINSDFYKVAYQGRILPYFKESVYVAFGKNYFASFLDMWADSNPVCDQEIFHVEENEQVWKFKVGANVAGAAGQPTVVTIDASSMYMSGAYSQVQPGYLLAFPPIGKLGRVTNVNGNQVTVTPFDSAYAIKLTAGQEVIIIPLQIRKPGSCEVGESSAVQPGLTYRSRLMIGTKDLKIEGSTLAKWCKKLQFIKTRSPLDPCQEVDVLWHADLDQMMLEFTQGWSMAFLMAEEVNNAHIDVAGYGGTVGYLPALRARGSNYTFAANTGIQIADVDAITDKIKTRRAYCTEYGIWAGKVIRRQLDDLLFTRLPNGAITYGTFEGSQQKAVDFGFQSFIKNGIEFHLHEEASFNDPGFLGANGFNGPNMAIMLPLCQLQCGNDITTPVAINYLSNEEAHYTREFEQWDHGVLKPESYQGTCDFHEWHLRAEKGFQIYGPQYHWLIEGL